MARSRTSGAESGTTYHVGRSPQGCGKPSKPVHQSFVSEGRCSGSWQGAARVSGSGMIGGVGVGGFAVDGAGGLGFDELAGADDLGPVEGIAGFEGFSVLMGADGLLENLLFQDARSDVTSAWVGRIGGHYSPENSGQAHRHDDPEGNPDRGEVAIGIDRHVMRVAVASGPRQECRGSSSHPGGDLDRAKHRAFLEGGDSCPPS